MVATRSRWIAGIAKPPSALSSDTVAVVSSFCAVMPASPNWADSAIVKQPACAAAISSSGLVPAPSSKRALKPYWVWFSTPLWVETVPLPSFRPPLQTALPLRLIIGFSFYFVMTAHVAVAFGQRVGLAVGGRVARERLVHVALRALRFVVLGV